jgi:NAD(P)-dependent dehydrogenase (short-subunit alcohol dehydrogenase family)
MSTAYVFGATGEIGTAIVSKFESEGYQVVRFSRNPVKGMYSLETLGRLPADLSRADCVVWASGTNLNDSIVDYNEENLRDLFDANLFYITEGLSVLRLANLLSTECQLVIISSVWQGLSKQNKFSYTVSKSSLAGLIHSLAADLSPRGMRVNGVLPGVVDTKMTRAALAPAQIQKIREQTPSDMLVSLEEVSNLAYFLGSPESRGINGQSIVVDGGWSVVRYV